MAFAIGTDEVSNDPIARLIDGESAGRFGFGNVERSEGAVAEKESVKLRGAGVAPMQEQ